MDVIDRSPLPKTPGDTYPTNPPSRPGLTLRCCPVFWVGRQASPCGILSTRSPSAPTATCRPPFSYSSSLALEACDEKDSFTIPAEWHVGQPPLGENRIDSEAWPLFRARRSRLSRGRTGRRRAARGQGGGRSGHGAGGSRPGRSDRRPARVAQRSMNAAGDPPADIARSARGTARRMPSRPGPRWPRSAASRSAGNDRSISSGSVQKRPTSTPPGLLAARWCSRTLKLCMGSPGQG